MNTLAVSGELRAHLAAGEFNEPNGPGPHFGDREEPAIRRPGRMRKRPGPARLLRVGIKADDFPAAGNLEHARRQRGQAPRLVGTVAEVARDHQVRTVMGKEEVGVLTPRCGQRPQ